MTDQTIRKKEPIDRTLGCFGLLFLAVLFFVLSYIGIQFSLSFNTSLLGDLIGFGLGVAAYVAGLPAIYFVLALRFGRRVLRGLFAWTKGAKAQQSRMSKHSHFLRDEIDELQAEQIAEERALAPVLEEANLFVLALVYSLVAGGVCLAGALLLSLWGKAAGHEPMLWVPLITITYFSVAWICLLIQYLNHRMQAD